LGIGLSHLFRPRRDGDLNGTFIPAIGFCAGDAASEFLAGHAGELLGFEDQLFRRSAVGRDHAAQRAHVANVADQGARIDIPDDGNFVAI
jgi:hypothetical protein